MINDMTNEKAYQEAVAKYPENFQEIEMGGMKCMVDMNKLYRTKYMLKLMEKETVQNG